MRWRRMYGTVAIVALASAFTNSGWSTHKDDHGTLVAAAAREGGDHGQQGPQISGCPILPADNVWNTPIDKLPRAQRSDEYIAKIGAEKPVHPDFGADGIGIPFSVIRGTVQRVPVSFEYHDDSDLGNYPIPPDASIEGGPNADGDRHVILIDQQRCLLYELYAARPKGDGSWSAAAGVKIDLTDNALREEGKTSADAAGLPIFPGLVRYEEVQSGEIRHALRFTAPKTQAAYVWPARHQASHTNDAAYPPLGMRFRLKADFDISGFSKENRVILSAMKRYGMLLADNGSSWFISGVPDQRWDNSDLNKLKRITGSDFETVDEAPLQMLVNSGRVDPLELR